MPLPPPKLALLRGLICCLQELSWCPFAGLASQGQAGPVFSCQTMSCCRHIAANAKQRLQCQDSEKQTIPWQSASLNPSSPLTNSKGDLEKLTCRGPFGEIVSFGPLWVFVELLSAVPPDRTPRAPKQVVTHRKDHCLASYQLCPARGFLTKQGLFMLLSKQAVPRGLFLPQHLNTLNWRDSLWVLPDASSFSVKNFGSWAEEMA